MRMANAHCLMSLMVAGACLTACAARDRVASSNPANVVIVREGTVESASARAAKECARYGKNSRLVMTQDLIMSFDCVP